MLEERNNWNSVAASRDVEVDRNKYKDGEWSCPLYSGEEDVKHILLDCLEKKKLENTVLTKSG
jgi:hypothetical protein